MALIATSISFFPIMLCSLKYGYIRLGFTVIIAEAYLFFEHLPFVKTFIIEL